MANLRVDKITSTETFETTGSVYFDGSTTNIRAGWVDDYNYLHNGTEDWTAEFWVYPQVENSRQTIFSTGGNSSVVGFCVRIMEQGVSGSSNGYYVSAQMSRGAGGNYIYWSSDPKKLEADTWYHIAVVFRSSNKSLEIYVDGELTNGKGDTGYIEGTFTTYSGSNAYSGLMLGHEPYGSSLKLTGFISNFRIVQGKLVYTENFKVPMKELEVIPGTTLLCCQSKYSPAAAKISPFISGVNDGTIWSDAQDVANGTRLRHTDHGDSPFMDAAKVFDARDDTDAETPNGTSTKLIFDFETLLGKKIPVSSSIKIKIGGSDGRTLKVNGTTIATNAGPTESVITNQSTLNKVEVVSEGSSRSGRLTYIKVDDVSLTLPILPFGKVLPSELSPGLLTNKVIDGGNSAIKGSVEFDGSPGSYLKVVETNDFDFGAGDFTMEYWYHEGNDARTERRVLYCFDTTQAFMIGHTNDNGGQLFFQAHDSGNNVISGGIIRTATSSNQTGKRNYWRHVAACREGATFRLFLDGVLQNTANFGTTALKADQNTLYIGRDPATNNREFRGFLSNLRIVKGTALYTHNFIPPTRELKKVPGTVLLCCQDSDDPTQEATGKNIIPYGVKFSEKKYGPELVHSNVWTLTGGGSGYSNFTVSQRGTHLSGTTVPSGYMRADMTLESTKKYYISLSWSGGAFAVQDSGGYTHALDGTDTEFSTSEDGTYHFIFDNSTLFRITASTWNTAYVVSNISVKEIYDDGTQKFTPQIGSNRKVKLEGVTKINTENYFYLPTGNTESRETTGTYNSGTRGIFGGGFSNPTTHHAIIQYINIASLGDAVEAGDLTQSRYGNAALASATRAVWAGGVNPSPAYFNTIDAVEIMTTGIAFDFGDLYGNVYYPGGVSNRTRGIYAGGYQVPSPSGFKNNIGFITIASKGDSQDFGDFTARNSYSTFGSATRGCFAGGSTPSKINTIEYVTIASTGDATDFGDLSEARNYAGGCSSAIRGLVGGGSTPTVVNTIDYVTIATTGTAVDFGDITTERAEVGSCSSATRGVFAGSWSPSKTDVIDFVNLQTTGNAVTFGALENPGVMQEMGTSNGHGGLG